VVGQLNPKRQTAYNSYYQVILNLLPSSDEDDLSLPDLDIKTWTPAELAPPISSQDLVFMMHEQAEGIRGEVLFDKALFRKETIQYLARGFVNLLEQAVEHPQSLLAEFVLEKDSTPRFPLSTPQREIWVHQMMHPALPLYNIGGHVKIPSKVDPALFEKAVNLLIQKHDVLRTVLVREHGEDGVQQQTYLDALSITLPVHDFSAQATPQKAALDWMAQRFEQPFQLTEQPLFRYDLLKTSETLFLWADAVSSTDCRWGCGCAAQSFLGRNLPTACPRPAPKTGKSFLC